MKRDTHTDRQIERHICTYIEEKEKDKQRIRAGSRK
jgi:hypothetical protein